MYRKTLSEKILAIDLARRQNFEIRKWQGKISPEIWILKSPGPTTFAKCNIFTENRYHRSSHYFLYWKTFFKKYLAIDLARRQNFEIRKWQGKISPEIWILKSPGPTTFAKCNIFTENRYHRSSHYFLYWKTFFKKYLAIDLARRQNFEI